MQRQGILRVFSLSVSLCLILGAVAVCAPEAQATKRIVLIGDSWTQWPWKSGAFQSVLNDVFGTNVYEVEGTYTAIGGSAAAMWAANADPGTGTFPTWDGQPHGLLDRLDYTLATNPTIDIVHMSLGGIDMLAGWRANFTPDQEQTLFLSIYDNVQIVVNHAKSVRPWIKVLWVDYDFLNITETCTYGMSEFSWTAAEAATLLGFTIGDFNQNRSNNEAVNRAFGRCALKKIEFVGVTPRTDYMQNFGNVQWRAGYTDSLGTWWGPYVVPYPGQYPTYSPLPGGNPQWGTPPVYMDHPDANTVDPIHLSPNGYKMLFDSCVANYYARWLLDIAAPSCTGIVRASANPTNAATVTFTVSFSEDVRGVDAVDFAIDASGVSGASIAGVNGSGATYTVTVNTGTGDGALSIDLVNNGTIFDMAWNGLSAGFTSAPAYTVDKTLPTVSMTSTLLPGPTPASPIPVTVTFSEAVTGFSLSDVTTTNALATNLWGSGASYGFELLPIDNGLVQADIAAASVQDQVGQANATGAHFQITYDTGGAGRSIYQSDGTLGNLTPDAGSALTINTTANSISWIAGGQPHTKTGRVSTGVCVFDFADVVLPALAISVSGNKPLSIAGTSDMSVGAAFNISPGTLGGGRGGLGGTGGIGGTGGGGGSGGSGGSGGKGGWGEDYATHSLAGNDCGGASGSNGSNGGTGSDGGIGDNGIVPGSNAGVGDKGYGDTAGAPGVAGSPGTNTPGGSGSGGAGSGGIGGGGSGAGGGGTRGFVTGGTGGNGGGGAGGGSATSNGSTGALGATGGQGGNAAYSDSVSLSSSLTFVAGHGGGGGGGAGGGGGGGGGAGGGGGQGGGGGGGGNYAQGGNQMKCTGGGGGGGGGARGGSGGGAGGGGGGGGGGAGGNLSGGIGSPGNAAASGGSQPSSNGGNGNPGNAGAGWRGDGTSWLFHPGPEGGYPGGGGPGGGGGSGGSGGGGGSGGQGSSGGGGIVFACRGLLTVSNAVDISAAAPANGASGAGGGAPSGGASGLAGAPGGGGGSGGSVQNPSFPFDWLYGSNGGSGGQGGSGGGGSSGSTGGSGGQGGPGGYGTPGCVKLHGSVVKASGATVNAGNVSSGSANNNGLVTFISNMTSTKVALNQPIYPVVTTVHGAATNDTLLKGVSIYDVSRLTPLIPNLAGGPATSGYCLTNYWNKTEVQAKLAGLGKPEIAKFQAGGDSYFEGYHQIVIVNTSASLSATGVYLKIGTYPGIPIGGTGVLAPMQAWTTCVDASINISDIALLNPVFIVQQPVGANLYVGDGHSMTVQTLGGVGTVLYQWRKDGGNISGATNAGYNLVNAVLTDAGSYTCSVTDDTGTIYSNAAALVVGNLPSITAQPQGRRAYTGDPHTFSVTATGGIGALTYHWRKNGVDLTNQTAASFTLNPLALGDAGTYACVVKDALLTSAPSDPALLEVAPAMQITSQPTGGSHQPGAPHTFTVVATGGYGALHYQWVKDGADLSDATDSSYTRTNLQPADSGQYVCVLTDDWGTPKVSDAAALYVGTGPSLSVTDLPDLVGYLGLPATFTVTASGGYGTVTYQWYKNGDPIAGGTASTYTIDVVSQGDDNTRYKCLVGDSFTFMWSPLPPRTEAVLHVAPPIQITQQPVGATSRSGVGHSFTVAASGGYGTLHYQWKKDGANLSNATGTSYAITSAQSSDSGAYRCAVTDDAPTTLLSNEAPLTIGDLVISGQTGGGHAYTGDAHGFSVTATGVGALSYQWRKNGGGVSGATNPTYSIAPVALGDAGTYVCHVADTLGSTDSTPAVLEVAPAIAITQQPAGTTLHAGEAYTLVTAATGGAGSLRYQWQKDGSAVSGATQASYAITSAQFSDDGIYRCRVTDDWATEVLTQPATVGVQGALTITEQPSGGAKAIGESHTFSIAVTGGSGAILYQWKKDGTSIPGATRSSYTIDSLALSDSGAYLCEVSDDFLTKVSDEAVLVVTYGLPVAGVLVVCMLAGACLTFGARSLRSRRR